MDLQEQVTRHAAEIGELRGKLDSLATKDFVRRENAALLKEITEKIDKQTDDIQNEIQKNRQFRTRVTAIFTVVAVTLSVLVAAINAFVGAVSIGLIRL
ncbi:MAG: hypothetical protein OXT68_12780 [Chloroflexota bacterium]|nr:hypothetical protein [Chloroflexota bacterium]MDE2951625.1 hypothetical protein [Chloroflexota bacterium]